MGAGTTETVPPNSGAPSAGSRFPERPEEAAHPSTKRKLYSQKRLVAPTSILFLSPVLRIKNESTKGNSGSERSFRRMRRREQREKMYPDLLTRFGWGGRVRTVALAVGSATVVLS